MKILRGVGELFSCILLFAGIMLYVIQDAAKHIVVESIVDNVVDQIIATSLESVVPDSLQGQLDELSLFMPSDMQEKVNEQAMDILGEEVWDQVEQVKKDMIDSHLLQDLSKEYIDAAIDGLIDGNIELPDVQKDMNDLAKTYVPQLSQAAGIEVTQEQLDRVMTKINDRIDINERLDEVYRHLHIELSSQQKNVLRFLRFVNHGSLLELSLAMIGIACILLIVSTRSMLRWIPYAAGSIMLSGIAMICEGKLLPMLLSASFEQLGTILIPILQVVFDALFQYGCLCFVIGAVAMLVYGLITFIKGRIVKA